MLSDEMKHFEANEADPYGADDLEKLAQAARAAILHNRTQPAEAEPAEAANFDDDPLPPPPAADPKIEEELKAKLKSALAALDQKDEEITQLKERVLRVSAEFDNFKKRSRKERAETVQFANEELIKELLPILDNLERALESNLKVNVPESFLKGVELINSQAHTIFEKLGVKAIPAVGQAFDPKFHDAVMRDQNSQLPENTVVQEFRKAYSLHDKIIRQAMVSVSAKANPGQAKSSEEPAKSDDADSSSAASES